jgi:carbon-monoxide dehydrogenase medium subunit
MPKKDIRYFEPTEVEEVVELLARLDGQAKLMAGGTDLIIDVNEGREAKGHIISLMAIQSIGAIRSGAALHIGATAVLNSIQLHPRVQRDFQMLSEAVATIGSWQIRAMGTMGGNMCNALPCADTAPPLYVAEAEIEIAGPAGRRVVPAEQFILAPRKNALAPAEMLVGFRLPSPPARTGSVFVKHTFRRALDMTIVAIAVAVSLDPLTDIMRRARIALGSAAPTPMRARQAELALEGRQLSDALLEEAAELAVQESRVHDSPIRASAEYRRDVIRVLTRRCIAEAARRATANGGGPNGEA